MHGAGRVGGNELHHDLFALTVVALAVALALVLDLTEYGGKIALAQKEVDEAGSRDLAFFDKRIFEIDVIQNDLRRLDGRHAEYARACHRHIGRDIAVGAVGGFFDDEARDLARGQSALLHRRGNSGFDLLSQVFGDIGVCFRHIHFPLLYDSAFPSRGRGTALRWMR